MGVLYLVSLGSQHFVCDFWSGMTALTVIINKLPIIANALPLSSWQVVMPHRRRRRSGLLFLFPYPDLAVAHDPCLEI
jgi:hypothetical protein